MTCTKHGDKLPGLVSTTKGLRWPDIQKRRKAGAGSACGTLQIILKREPVLFMGEADHASSEMAAAGYLPAIPPETFSGGARTLNIYAHMGNNSLRRDCGSAMPNFDGTGPLKRGRGIRRELEPCRHSTCGRSGKVQDHESPVQSGDCQ